VPAIVSGIHEAFSVALAATFWVGIAGALVGAACVLFLQEAPMRETFHVEESVTPAREESPA
jgi:hypothetical protein